MLFGILAVIAAGLNFVLIGMAAHTNAWFSPEALISLAIAFLALHVLGADAWIRR
jgi:hypothetical protein